MGTDAHMTRTAPIISLTAGREILYSPVRPSAFRFEDTAQQNF